MNEARETGIQFVKFSFVGVSNTLISYVVYAVFIALGFHYLVGSVVGFAASVLNSFYWNNKYVFKKKEGEQRKLISAFVKVFMSYALTGLVLANILLVIWVDVLHLSEYLGPVLNLFITVPLNFILNKVWAFQNQKEER
jgi:putative flippase GtrA